MKLSAFLTQTDTPLVRFAAAIGCDRGTMSRIVRGLQIPRPDLMARIYQATDGAVAPNDFYTLDSRHASSSPSPNSAAAP